MEKVVSLRSPFLFDVQEPEIMLNHSGIDMELRCC